VADCYATVQYYDAVRTLARLERELLAHPEWNTRAACWLLIPGCWSGMPRM
jgi:hypothetical protein